MIKEPPLLKVTATEEQLLKQDSTKSKRARSVGRGERHEKRREDRMEIIVTTSARKETRGKQTKGTVERGRHKEKSNSSGCFGCLSTKGRTFKCYFYNTKNLRTF